MALRFMLVNGAQATRQATHEFLRGIYWDIRKTATRNGRKGSDSGGGDEDDDSARKLLGEDDDDDDDGGGLLQNHQLRYGNGVTDSEFGVRDDVPAGEASAAGRDSYAEQDVHTAVLDADIEAEAGVRDRDMAAAPRANVASPEKLSLRATAWLSLEFCMLWFLANYFAVACLEYTSVASATIFTSLSGVFTLLICALARVESFSVRKLVGVLASLAGVALVSSVDLSGKSDENRGDFPHKTTAEIATGDTMALLSAVVYGAYVTVMKQRVGHEDRVDMSLFFGLVGLFNVVFLWPGLILLHVTGIERVSRCRIKERRKEVVCGSGC